MKTQKRKPKVSSVFMGLGTYKCQYCQKESPIKKWKKGTICPACGGVYDAILAQESDD